MEDKILSSLGLSAKAGKLIFGVPLICEALRRSNGKDVFLVVESGDTSANTNKRLNDKCSFYKVEKAKLICDGERLAQAVGKMGTLGAVAITDKSLAEMVKKRLAANESQSKA